MNRGIDGAPKATAEVKRKLRQRAIIILIAFIPLTLTIVIIIIFTAPQTGRGLLKKILAPLITIPSQARSDRSEEYNREWKRNNLEHYPFLHDTLFPEQPPSPSARSADVFISIGKIRAIVTYDTNTFAVDADILLSIDDGNDKLKNELIRQQEILKDNLRGAIESRHYGEIGDINEIKGTMLNMVRDMNPLFRAGVKEVHFEKYSITRVNYP